jgi:1-acyl-sn-glycerol-3-phosphate acyltransferase
MRHALAPLRVLLLLLHVLEGLFVAGLFYRFMSQATRNRILRWWSQVLLAICGVRLRVAGRAPDGEFARTGIANSPGVLQLVNHVSWIDVYALNAALPSRFVAKSEIASWPLLGPLVSLVGTLYIERGRRHAVAAINHKVRDRLHAGEAIAIFPEGTTTDGTSLLPFHSNLVAPAVEVGCDVWPVALRYDERGAPSTAAAFVGDMGLHTCLWNILVARDLAVEVAFLEPVTTHPDRNRHHIAHAAHVRIAEYLGVEPAPARASLRRDPAPQTDRDTAPA